MNDIDKMARLKSSFFVSSFVLGGGVSSGGPSGVAQGGPQGYILLGVVFCSHGELALDGL